MCSCLVDSLLGDVRGVFALRLLLGDVRGVFALQRMDGHPEGVDGWQRACTPVHGLNALQVCSEFVLRILFVALLPTASPIYYYGYCFADSLRMFALCLNDWNIVWNHRFVCFLLFELCLNALQIKRSRSWSTDFLSLLLLLLCR